MRAELFHPDEPDRLVAAAAWRDGRVELDPADEEATALLRRVFHASSVPLDDPSLRPPGASGTVMIEAGDLEWFRVAGLVRSRAEGLGVRFVTDSPGGWDPAMDPQTYGWAGRKPALPHEA